MNQRKGTNSLIRRKADFLPGTFISRELDGKLLAPLARCFERLLLKYHAGSDFALRLWRSMLEKHSLLEVRVPLELIFGRLEVEFRSTGGTTNRRVIEVSEPISCGFQNVRLPIEWPKTGEEAYRNQTAAILAYMLAWRLSAHGAQLHDLIVLDHIDEVTLEEHLSSCPRGKISVRSLANSVVERIVKSEMEGLSGVDFLPVRHS